jgi:hypothetical protein
VKYKLKRELEMNHTENRSRVAEARKTANMDNFWMGSYMLREKGKDNPNVF